MPSGENGDGKVPTRESILAEFRDEFTALMKLGDVPARERKLNQRNFKLRLKNRELEQQVADASGAKPKDGQVLLSKEDATEFDAFKKLNLKAADLVTLVKEHGDQKGRLAERDAEELYVDVADAMGFENLPAFMRFMEREKLHVEFQDVRVKDEETGKTEVVRTPMVRLKADEKAQLEALSDYVEREVPEFVEIFQTASDETEEVAGAGAGDVAAPTTFATRLKRMGAGDPQARREAGLKPNGVTMPVTRNARPSTGTSQTEKKQREAYEQKRKNPEYASL
jgi:hypothetical protein